jgi:hypothetical protein|tara:strand:- start:503 stop:976 length:474 start_codon:yes stop_codon:yes gene_type:complete
MAFKHIGKKVELASTRIDKDLFLEKAKTVTNGKINLALVGTDGKVLPSNVSAVVSTLGDNNDAITQLDLVKGLMKITPTSSRTKAFPSAGDIIDTFNFITDFQFVDVSIINLAAANTVQVSAGTSVTIHGNAVVRGGASGLFKIVKLSDTIDVYRIA